MTTSTLQAFSKLSDDFKTQGVIEVRSGQRNVAHYYMDNGRIYALAVRSQLIPVKDRLRWSTNVDMSSIDIQNIFEYTTDQQVFPTLITAQIIEPASLERIVKDYFLRYSDEILLSWSNVQISWHENQILPEEEYYYRIPPISTDKLVQRIISRYQEVEAFYSWLNISMVELGEIIISPGINVVVPETDEENLVLQLSVRNPNLSKIVQESGCIGTAQIVRAIYDLYTVGAIKIYHNGEVLTPTGNSESIVTDTNEELQGDAIGTVAEDEATSEFEDPEPAVATTSEIDLQFEDTHASEEEAQPVTSEESYEQEENNEPDQEPVGETVEESSEEVTTEEVEQGRENTTEESTLEENAEEVNAGSTEDELLALEGTSVIDDAHVDSRADDEVGIVEEENGSTLELEHNSAEVDEDSEEEKEFSVDDTAELIALLARVKNAKKKIQEDLANVQERLQTYDSELIKLAEKRRELLPQQEELEEKISDKTALVDQIRQDLLKATKELSEMQEESDLVSREVNEISLEESRVLHEKSIDESTESALRERLESLSL